MFKKLIWVALGVLLLVPLVWAGTVAQNSSEGVPGFGLMFQNPPNDNYPFMPRGLALRSAHAPIIWPGKNHPETISPA